jgi:hypothetical protein
MTKRHCEVHSIEGKKEGPFPPHQRAHPNDESRAAFHNADSNVAFQERA